MSGGRIEHRGLVATVSIVAVLTLTACGGNTVRSAYRSLEGPLSRGLDESRLVLDDLAGAAVRDGAVDPPPGLSRGLAELPPGAASADEQAIVEEARRLEAFYLAFDETLAAADALGAGLPAEARELLALLLRADVDPRFADDVEEATARLLKSATCELARSELDAAADDASSGQASYEEIGVDEPGAAARWISAQLSPQWDPAGVAAVLDLASLASRTLDRSVELVDGMGPVIDSPDGAIRRSELLYLRLCVLH